MIKIRNFVHKHRMWFHVTSVCLTLATLVLAVLWNLHPEDNRYEPATVALAILTALIGGPSLFELLAPPPQPSQNPLEESPTELTKLLFIVDCLCNVADSINIWDGLDGKKRKLHLIRKLHASALAYFDLAFEGTNENISNKVLIFLREILPELLSELDYVHLYSSEEERPNGGRLSQLKYLVRNEWESITEILLEDKELKFDFAKLKVDEKQWRLIGFDDEESYKDYIAPSIATLCKNASPAEKQLLSEIVNMEEFTIDMLRIKGYAEGILVETINCFYRERILVDKGNGNLSVSDLGKRLIIGCLEGR